MIAVQQPALGNPGEKDRLHQSGSRVTHDWSTWGAVLVTGGAGYIGSHVCKSLASAGYRPVVYDNLSRGHRSAVNWGPLEVGDITDGQALRSALARHEVDTVVHLAAYAYVGEFGQRPGDLLPK